MQNPLSISPALFLHIHRLLFVSNEYKSRIHQFIENSHNTQVLCLEETMMSPDNNKPKNMERNNFL